MGFNAASFLEAQGLRITRPRASMARILFADGSDRHVTAEWLAEELDRQGQPVALATVYNTLHSFVKSGALREVRGASANTIVFDTNTADHHHFYDEATGELTDIPASALSIEGLPGTPDGKMISGLDLIIRLR